MTAPSVKRKLTTILSADVAGYSRLMGEDEEATLHTLTAYREAMDGLIVGHDGRVVGSAGDSVLAEFVSAVEAARCALAIQDQLAARNARLAEHRRLEFRIGINLGDVMVKGGDLFGDGVNVAARLQELASPGGVYISGGVYDQIKGKLDSGYQDLGEHQVKNIAEPVRVYRLGADGGAVADVAGPRPRRWLWVALAAAVLVLAASSVAIWLLLARDTPAPVASESPPVLELPAAPAIAVLPFTNMSGDPAQDYFSDGITEDLITDLSQISGLFVIARNSSFTYKGTPVKVQQVGRELGVHYVLEGSVRRVGDRVRINAQLVDARTGLHLWAERYDRDLVDVFALQDEVTQKIVAALAVKLTTNEQERLSRAAESNPEAYDTMLRGLARLRRYTREGNVEARAFFEQAIALDPNYARAHANLAYTYATDVQNEWARAPDQAIARALEIAGEALALDASVRQVHFALGLIRLFDKRHDQAIAAARRALELDPNYADAYGQMALTLNYAGRPEAALEAIRKAMRLDPRHPFFYVWIKGQAYFLMRRYDAAIAEFERVVERNPEFPRGHLALAAAYAQVGRIEDAEWEAQETLVLLPDFTLARVRQREPYKDPAHLDRYIEALRKAGLPE